MNVLSFALPVLLFGLTAAQSCETSWSLYGEACYYKTTGYSTYEQAEKYCQDRNSVVVTVHSPAEQSFVQGLFDPPRAYWIGLLPVSGQWKWADSEPLSYHNFRSGLPSASTTQCVMSGYAIDSDGKWDLVDCMTAKKVYEGVICKKYHSIRSTSTTTSTTTTTASPAPVSCTKDGHCTTVQLCQHGLCASNTGSCTSDQNCASPQTCRYQMCGLPVVPPTTSTSTTSTTTTTTSPPVTCSADSVCKFEELCQSGVCTNGTKSCNGDAECDQPETCRYKMCGLPVVPPTTSTSTTSTTTTTTSPPVTCSADSVCKFEELCQRGVCTNGTRSCNGDAECDQPETCRFNMCGLPETVNCATDGDCGEHQLCQYGICEGNQDPNNSPCINDAACYELSTEWVLDDGYECRFSMCGFPEPCTGHGTPCGDGTIDRRCSAGGCVKTSTLPGCDQFLDCVARRETHGVRDCVDGFCTLP